MQTFKIKLIVFRKECGITIVAVLDSVAGCSGQVHPWLSRHDNYFVIDVECSLQEEYVVCQICK